MIHCHEGKDAGAGRTVWKMPRVRVIGFGNPAAGDDAAGLIAAAWAREELRGEPSVEVVEASAGTRALDLMEGADAVVVVEAVHAPDGQRQPGRLVRAVAGQDGLVEHAGPTVSSSQSIPTQTIGLAATLGTGRRVVFVGVVVDFDRRVDTGGGREREGRPTFPVSLHRDLLSGIESVGQSSDVERLRTGDAE